MKNSSFEIKPFIFLCAALMVLCFCLDTTEETLRNHRYLFLFLSIAAVFFACMGKEGLKRIDIIYLVIALGILIKFSYVLYTAVWTRQHDVVGFGTGEGHAGYIEYIYFNNALPKGDPREIWAFFQPPLHHIVSAVWMKVCNRFGLAYRQLQENIQALPLFYVSGTAFVSYFICKELGLKKRGTLAAMLLISFHPVFIIMSGSINNDALSLFLMVAALYMLILWHKRPDVPKILLLAVLLGLSMLAKLSAGMLAPAIAALFLSKLVTDRDNIKKYILQYLLFAIVVFPLGIGWEIRNMLKFGMPFNYIPPVGEQLVKTDLFSRFLDIRTKSIYPCMVSNGDAYDEYNVLLALFKTSLFDDVNMSQEWRVLGPFSLILFISGLLLFFLCLYATARVLLKKGEGALPFEWKLMLSVFYFSMLIAYFSFALGYSNYSAQSFRYISASVIVEAVFLGIYADSLGGASDERAQRLYRVICTLLIVFSVSSVAVYTLLGFAVTA